MIDARKFRFMVDEVPNFMVDEVPNFAQYVMGAMARRIRGMGQVLK